MKKTISIMALVFVMIFCCLFAVGCGDDSSSAAQSAVPESIQSEQDSKKKDADTVRKAAEDFYGRIRSESSKSHSIRDAMSALQNGIDYFALRKALYRTLESTISLHGKHQRAARKALPISCS